jgi:NAD(P)-dependent dehydrogenase (short-subunit alcohol dehydrogenase family)
MDTNTQKTALITGASRGLGLALARELAQKGWNLVLDARGAGDLETARAELAGHTAVVAIPGDVTDAEHRQALAAAVRELGGLDALVNNASILGPSPQPELLDYPLDMLETVYRTNVVAPLALAQAVGADLKPGARIVNVTSDAAVEPYEGWGGYGSSKAALDQLSAILGAENPDLHVYSIDPGDMRTGMQQEAFPDEDISDRPLPEESVPGIVELLTGDLPSGRYRARELEAEPTPGVRQLRVALTVEDPDASARLYGGLLGMPVVEEWDRPEGRGIILDAGSATVELVDHRQAEHIDAVEVGERVSGPVRLALEVPDVEAYAGSLETAAGAETPNDPVLTPWGDLNLRTRDRDGMQITLFQPTHQNHPTEAV